MGGGGEEGERTRCVREGQMRGAGGIDGLGGLGVGRCVKCGRRRWVGWVGCGRGGWVERAPVQAPPHTHTHTRTPSDSNVSGRALSHRSEIAQDVQTPFRPLPPRRALVGWGAPVPTRAGRPEGSLSAVVPSVCMGGACPYQSWAP
eukprot:358949-Chlamydomonas_euryale.AAC.5